MLLFQIWGKKSAYFYQVEKYYKQIYDLAEAIFKLRYKHQSLILDYHNACITYIIN
jgi:hypothetical protein